MSERRNPLLYARWIQQERQGRPTQLPRLPDSFLFGVGSSDHQHEAYDPRYEDIHDFWARRNGRTLRDRATDFWNRYPEDIALAQGLGCKIFRFSVAWARVEPEPGIFNDEALEHYRQVAQTVREAGMEPLLTLHHFTWPLHVEARGGMIGEDFPAIFARYTAEVVNALGRQVRYWISFNEPSQLIYGYLKPWWERSYFLPPGLPDGAGMRDQLIACQQLMRNVFLAHSAARRVIKSDNPAAMVGTNPLVIGLPAWFRNLLDRMLVQLHRPADWLAPQAHSVPDNLPAYVVSAAAGALYGPTDGKRARSLRGARLVNESRALLRLLTLTLGNWWHLGMAGRLSPFLCPPTCIGQQDFVGIDYYWGTNTVQLAHLGRLVDAAVGRFDRAPVAPDRLYDVLRLHAAMFPDTPIFLLENGSVARSDGIDRATYLRRHVCQLQRACRDGIPVGAYLYWSLTSNREWGAAFHPCNDFGLYHIDLDTDPDLKRVPTELAEVYRTIIAARGV